MPSSLALEEPREIQAPQPPLRVVLPEAEDQPRHHHDCTEHERLSGYQLTIAELGERALADMLLEQSRIGYWIIVARAQGPRFSTARAPGRGRRPRPQEHFEAVAAVYLDDSPRRLLTPRQEVAALWCVDPTTASNWIRECRRRGLLP